MLVRPIVGCETKAFCFSAKTNKQPTPIEKQKSIVRFVSLAGANGLKKL